MISEEIMAFLARAMFVNFANNFCSNKPYEEEKNETNIFKVWEVLLI